jgi:hypothetical protein
MVEEQVGMSEDHVPLYHWTLWLKFLGLATEVLSCNDGIINPQHNACESGHNFFKILTFISHVFSCDPSDIWGNFFKKSESSLHMVKNVALGFTDLITT